MTARRITLALCVTLAAAAGAAAQPALESRVPSVRLLVADSGPGIALAQRQRLFQPFAAGAPSSEAPQGSGLGLAICHEIVQALGGRIALIDRVHAGSVTGLDAVVELPAALAENGA